MNGSSNRSGPVHTSIAVPPVQVWLAALRETDEQDPTEQRFICEDHFLPEDISRNEVSSEAIPIMPPCVGGDLGMMGSWGSAPEEEDDPWTMDADEEDEDDLGAPAGEPPPSGQVGRPSPSISSCVCGWELSVFHTRRLLLISRMQLRTKLQRRRHGNRTELHLCFIGQLT